MEHEGIPVRKPDILNPNKVILKPRVTLNKFKMETSLNTTQTKAIIALA